MAFTSRKLKDLVNVIKNPKCFLKEDSDSDVSTNDLSDSEKVLDDEHIVDIDEEIPIYDKDVEFQILDIDFYNSENDEGKKQFHIMLFGKTVDDKSIYVNVKNFKPYFFVEVEKHWRYETIKRILEDVKRKVPKSLKDGLEKYELSKFHKFKGFTNNEEFNYMKLIFSDYDSMRSYSYAFEKKHNLRYLSNKKTKFNVYESSLPPMLRFLHIQKIDPVGWCKINKEHYLPFDETGLRKGTTEININCDWTNVLPIDKTDIHKFKIVAFDIECTSEDGKFPCNREGDKIIQIGLTYSYLGDSNCFKQVILCLEKTDLIEGADVRCFRTEEKLMLAMTDEIHSEDPDIIIGYNTHGFDWDYLKGRATKFNINKEFSKLSRIRGHSCKYVEQKLESAALGRNNLKYYHTPGRVCIDLMKVVMRDFKLNGYKLDNVAANFIRDKISSYEYIYDDIYSENSDSSVSDCYSSDKEDDNDDIHIRKKQNIINKNKILFTKIKVKSTFGIKKDDYIAMYYNDGPTDNIIGKKQKVIELGDNYIIVKNKIRLRPYLKNGWKVFWCQAKDDVEPKDIFRFFKENSKKRAIIAKYCLKDCSLCNRLIAKLQILPNSIGMSNVCCVPLSFLFLRGQSIKIFSLVAKQCREERYLIPNIKRKKDDKFVKQYEETDSEVDDVLDMGYEGATVFDPTKGIHYEPIIVGDYSSLYPSCMIERNFSHDSIVLDPLYDNLPEYTYINQTYNNPDGTKTTCRYAQGKNKSIIPRILQKLLSERKKFKKMMDSEPDLFRKAVLDGLQLAYKVTANSLYGQCGSAVSPISMKQIAACTTARGREMLEGAKYFVENQMKNLIKLMRLDDETKYIEYFSKYFKNVSDNIEKKGEYKGKLEFFHWIKKKVYPLIRDYNVKPQCIYGDTDSVFFKLNMSYISDNKPFFDHESLKISIQLGIVLISVYNYTLDLPQCLAYEKVYWPFIILSKKRYVGNLYEEDPDKFYQKSMGLVTKRRDNADIVKVIVGGIIDQLLNKRSKEGAINLTKNILNKIITNKYDINKFVISKTLKDKDAYKDWTRMVHVVLADRMAQRDAGNKPQSNDRVPYVYIEINKKNVLQGERVEHPQYILENSLKIDYSFYITNQIMKPAMQFLEWVCLNPDAIFRKYLIVEENRKSGIDPIMKYFKKVDGDNSIKFNTDINSLFS